jgi:hypothetical protein
MGKSFPDVACAIRGEATVIKMAHEILVKCLRVTEPVPCGRTFAAQTKE